MLCSCQPCRTACLLQLSVFRITENLKGSAVTWYNIHFVTLLIKEGSKFRKQHSSSRKEKNVQPGTRNPHVLHHADSQACARSQCNKSEICVVLVIPVISDFLGHHEDEDQQALYPCNYCQPPLTHRHLSSLLSSLSSSRMGCGSWQMQNDDLKQQ